MCFRLVLQFAMKIEMKGSFMILHNQCCFINDFIIIILLYCQFNEEDAIPY